MGCGRLRPAGLGREPCVGAALLPDPGCRGDVPYLYIGFLAKKKHLLDEPLPPKVFAGLLAATALIAVGALATRTTDCISLAEWSLGPLSIFLDGAAGLLFSSGCSCGSAMAMAPSCTFWKRWAAVR